MKTVTYESLEATTVDIVPAAPSGGRYVLTGLSCSNGEVRAITSTTSGIYASTFDGAPLTGLSAYPSGNQGYGEALKIITTAPCTAIVSYILQVPEGTVNEFSITNRAHEHANRVSDQSWTDVVQSGSYRTGGFGG